MAFSYLRLFFLQNSSHLVALLRWLLVWAAASSVGRGETSSFCRSIALAVHSERRSAPPHPEAAAPGD